MSRPSSTREHRQHQRGVFVMAADAADDDAPSSPRRVLVDKAQSFLVRSASAMTSVPEGIALSRRSALDLTHARRLLPAPMYTLARSLSQQLDDLLAADEVRETFFCEICLGNVDEDLRASLSGCDNPAHNFCRMCLRRWLESRIEEGIVHIPCPMRGVGGGVPSIDCDVLSMDDDGHANDHGGPGRSCGCNGMASYADVVEFCNAETYKRYQRFSLLKGPEADEYRECPRCAHLNRGGILRNAVSFVYEGFKPVVRCRNCHHRFCFYHGDSHSPDSSCLAYAVRLRRAERSMSGSGGCGIGGHGGGTARPPDSKLCPRCRAPTSKIGGCNHMTCVECLRRFGATTHWCWLCGRNFGSGADGARGASEHYRSADVSAGGWAGAGAAFGKEGCPGGHFADAESYITHGRFRLATRITGMIVTAAALALWVWWTWRARWVLLAFSVFALFECWRWGPPRQRSVNDDDSDEDEETLLGRDRMGSADSTGSYFENLGLTKHADADEVAARSRWLITTLLVAALFWIGVPAAVLFVAYAIVSVLWALVMTGLLLLSIPAIALTYWYMRYCGPAETGFSRLDRSVDFLLAVEQRFRFLVFFPLLSNKFGNMLTATAQSALRSNFVRKALPRWIWKRRNRTDRVA